MKKNSLFKILGVIIVIAILLTWIFPITYFGYELMEEPRSQVGLFELFTYGNMVFYYFGNIFFYILAIGGFYGVLHQIDGYRNLLDKIARKFKGKEYVYFIVIITLLTLLTSMAGLTTALLLLLPFITSVIVIMGYNKQTAALVTLGSISVGLIGTTVSDVNTGIISSILKLDNNSAIWAKVVILVLGLILLITSVLLYARKHKVENSNEEIILPVSTNSKKRSWPIIIIMDLILLIMIVSSVSWSTVFGVELFSKIHTKIMSLSVGGFNIFAKIFGEGYVVEFGKWTLTEFTLLVVIGTVLIGIFYRKRISEFFTAYFEGMKKTFKPLILIFMAYVVLIIGATHPVMLTIFKPLLTLTSGFNVFTMSLTAFVNSVVYVDAYYAVSGTLPYFASIASAASDVATYPVVGLVWQSMYGLAALVAPTSLVLIATLSYLEISFWEWIKTSWKLFVSLLVVILLALTIVLAII